MHKLISDRTLTLLNFTIVFYFVLLWVIDFYKVDFVLIGVFSQLLTIPFLVAQIIFIIVGLNYIIYNKKQTLTIISILALAISTIVTVGGFFW